MHNYMHQFNMVQTENGANAFATSGSAVLDFYAMAGGLRHQDASRVTKLFYAAHNEDPTLAMRALFNVRDIRGGAGERNTFRMLIKSLADNGLLSENNINLVPEFGRWDDLMPLLDTPSANVVVRMVKEQAVKDWDAVKAGDRSQSLMAKWLPSENASSKLTKASARKLRKLLGASPRSYRKLLTALRAGLNLVENKISNSKWSEVDYGKIPSRAGFVYRKAFARHDGERYSAFFAKAAKGEVKMNSATLFPHEIVAQCLHYYESHDYLEAAWKNLPDLFQGNSENSIVVADVSGSMMGDPLNVSIALAMYIAERNTGPFHNKFITFSGDPVMETLTGDTLVQRVRNLSKAHWEMNTDVAKVFRRLLDVAVRNRLSNSDMVKKVYIISDMEFDQATSGSTDTTFGIVGREYAAKGYTLPQLVFWNVRSGQNQLPVAKEQRGMVMVSGFSPNAIAQLIGKDGIPTPYQHMLNVLNSERYAAVTA